MIPACGEQEQSAYNGPFGSTCYRPLLLFNREDLLLEAQNDHQEKQRNRLAHKHSGGPLQIVVSSCARRTCEWFRTSIFRSGKLSCSRACRSCAVCIVVSVISGQSAISLGQLAAYAIAIRRLIRRHEWCFAGGMHMKTAD